MRSARGAKGQSVPARKVLVKLVWKDPRSKAPGTHSCSGFLSLLNASRERAVTARTANLPVRGFYVAAAGQVQNVRVFTYMQGSPANAVILCGSSSRPCFFSPPSQSICMIINVVTS